MGAQYLIINRHTPNKLISALAGFPCFFQYSNNNILLCTRNELSFELFLFLRQCSGKFFKEKNNNHGWSDLIWDLIEMGLHNVFNRISSGYNNQSRIGRLASDQLDGSFFISNSISTTHSVIDQIIGENNTIKLLSYVDHGTNIPNSNDILMDYTAGISLVLIETEEMNSQYLSSKNNQ